MGLIDFAEKGWLPDPVIRIGIRRLLGKRLTDSAVSDPNATETLAKELRNSPLAIETDAANTQHYEVPAAFYQTVLGPRLKYSCCSYEEPCNSLAQAEIEMLRLACDRAELADGMQILELGCGWGSLTLYMAEQYPSAFITAVSNSSSQRAYIESQSEQRGLSNVRVITANMRDFEADSKYDRVVSVEMFEHMRNYELLFSRIASWLTDSGKLFVHIFCHRTTPYLFQIEGEDNWMGCHFFTGGTMPSEALFDQFNADLSVTQRWQHNGLHYWRTCKHWLQNLDRSRSSLLKLFGQDHSPREAKIVLQRWRMFFMACAELFRYREGTEWYVSHYLLEQTKQ